MALYLLKIVRDVNNVYGENECGCQADIDVCDVHSSLGREMGTYILLSAHR